MLREKGVQEWYFNENSQLEKLDFQTKEKDEVASYPTELVTRMHNYPIHEIIVVPYSHHEFNQKLIQDTINSLTEENLRIFL